MRIGDVNSGAAKLHDALETVELAWQEAQTKWDDSAGRNFEENHVKPIAPNVKATLDAINRLSEVFARAQRDCGESF